MSSHEDLGRREVLAIGVIAAATLTATAATASDKPPTISAPAEARSVVVTLQLSAANADAFKDHLLKVIPVTRTASGCRYSHSYQSTKSPSEFLLIQGWDSVEQQESYLAWRAARGDLAVFRAFLAKDPIVGAFALFDA
jgi:quinol monooxygenase YgiN